MLQITAVGNLAADPEIKTVSTKDGEQQVANFILLVNKRGKGDDIVSTLRCAVWGARSKVVADFFTVGSQVTVTGQAYIEAYTRKDGTAGAQLNVSVADFSLPPKPKTVADDDMPF
jgi:single-stranded DNA-binding protein